MKKVVFCMLASVFCCSILVSDSLAQDQKGGRGNGEGTQQRRRGGQERGGRGRGLGNRQGGAEQAVARLMRLDNNEDGKLSSDEWKDARMKSLLERADTNNDSVVTKEELTTLMAEEMQAGGGPGMEGRGGRGRPSMMRPGLIMPEFLYERLQVSEEQKEALAKLQATVDAELKKILSAEQQEMLQQMGQRQGRGGESGRRGAGRGEGPEGEGGRGAGRGRRPLVSS